MVTFGVLLTTLSAVSSSARGGKANSLSAPPTDVRLYMTGISILFVALLLSSVLGIVQDLTYAAHRKRVAENGPSNAPTTTAPWQESMFYMHFLSLPMFWMMRHDLFTQYQTLALSPSIHLAAPPIPDFVGANLSAYSISVPSALVFLFLNTITQLVCVAGVHRLTSRVSSLTVTLLLVVRKAVSLLISVFLFSDRYERMDLTSRAMMLGGAGMVFAGTFAYSLVPKREDAVEKSKKD